jgi:uncharacterized protein (DUF983 family)
MQGKKKLIQPHIDQKLSGVNQLGVNPVYGGKNYQLFCPKCGFGPMISALTKTTCSACNRVLILVPMPDGAYKVAVVE